MIFEILILIATILAIHYVYLLRNRNYWNDRGVFCPQSSSLIGNLPGQVTGKRSMVYDLDDLYKKYKNRHPYIGIFNFRSPRLLLFDPALIKDILIKYFKNFQATEFTNRIDENSDPLFGNHPFFLVGEAWKKKRAEVSPAFSNARVSKKIIVKLKFIKVNYNFNLIQIKALYPIIADNCDKLINFIKTQENDKIFEAFDAKDVTIFYLFVKITIGLKKIYFYLFSLQQGIRFQ